MTKKGQAGPAASLVAIIAGLILLYLLLLPANVREGLLNGTTTTTAGTQASQRTGSTVLVFEHPGTLDPLKNRDREKVLDSFNLYAEKSAVQLKIVPALHVENGWFTQQTYNLSFKVDNPDNTDNYILAFDASQAQGRLVITLNGKEIYNSQLSVGNVEPIKIDKEDVKAQNSLIFTVSNVGLAFWKINEYDLQNVKVIADFIDLSKREYNNFFILSSTEKENLEQSTLAFVPDCLTPEKGPISIAINNKPLHYSAVPDCGTLSKIEFDPSLLKQGDNTISFKADQGNYFVDRISVKLTLKQLDYPFYYFELKPKDMQEITNQTANITLSLRFADLETKTGELNVDGHLSSIETDNATFTKDLSIFVEEGQNYLQVVPKSSPLNIVDLKVTLDK